MPSFKNILSLKDVRLDIFDEQKYILTPTVASKAVREAKRLGQSVLSGSCDAYLIFDVYLDNASYDIVKDFKITDDNIDQIIKDNQEYLFQVIEGGVSDKLRITLEALISSEDSEVDTLIDIPEYYNFSDLRPVYYFDVTKSTEQEDWYEVVVRVTLAYTLYLESESIEE